MTRPLLALALAAALAAPASADPPVTPGCDYPVDVACDMAYNPNPDPEHPSMPIPCLVWVSTHGCVVEG